MSQKIEKKVEIWRWIFLQLRTATGGRRMKTGTIRDFIVEYGLEGELLKFAPNEEVREIKDWLDSEDPEEI